MHVYMLYIHCISKRAISNVLPVISKSLSNISPTMLLLEIFVRLLSAAVSINGLNNSISVR